MSHEVSQFSSEQNDIALNSRNLYRNKKSIGSEAKVRTIKFRGMTKDKKWVYGYYCYADNGHYILPSSQKPLAFYDSFRKISRIVGFVEVLPETVGQFIGLHDKNDKEIYEGDIVEFNVVVPIWDEEKHIVKEHRPEVWRRAVEYKAPKFWIHWYPEKLEVIGNVHENPELLGERVWIATLYARICEPK